MNKILPEVGLNLCTFKQKLKKITFFVPLINSNEYLLSLYFY